MLGRLWFLFIKKFLFENMDILRDQDFFDNTFNKYQTKYINTFFPISTSLQRRKVGRKIHMRVSQHEMTRLFRSVTKESGVTVCSTHVKFVILILELKKTTKDSGLKTLQFRKIKECLPLSSSFKYLKSDHVFFKECMNPGLITLL